MPRCAILSDIHGNLAAMRAVLADIERVGVDEIWCLGDIVGYGPNPVECFKLAMKHCSIMIMGNHEKALAPGGGDRFNRRAKQAIDWTRATLLADPQGEKITAKLLSLPKCFSRQGILFAHGSPAETTDEYLMPRDARNPAKMKKQFDIIEGYAFVGHTHYPGVIEEGHDFVPPEKMMMNVYMLDYDTKAIINVGSVGQPRDKNPDACYVTFDGDSVVYRRVPYRVADTRARVLATPGLDDFLGERLLEGK